MALAKDYKPVSRWLAIVSRRLRFRRRPGFHPVKEFSDEHPAHSAQRPHERRRGLQRPGFRRRPGGRRCQRRCGGGGDARGDVGGQTTQIVGKIDQLLAEAGSSKERIVSANIWLADIATFGQMNGIWDAWVPAGEPPARACVESRLAFPQYTVEIAVIAAQGR